MGCIHIFLDALNTLITPFSEGTDQAIAGEKKTPNESINLGSFSQINADKFQCKPRRRPRTARAGKGGPAPPAPHGSAPALPPLTCSGTATGTGTGSGTRRGGAYPGVGSRDEGVVKGAWPKPEGVVSQEGAVSLSGIAYGRGFSGAWPLWGVALAGAASRGQHAAARRRWGGVTHAPHPGGVPSLTGVTPPVSPARCPAPSQVSLPAPNAPLPPCVSPMCPPSPAVPPPGCPPFPWMSPLPLEDPPRPGWLCWQLAPSGCRLPGARGDSGAAARSARTLPC